MGEAKKVTRKKTVDERFDEVAEAFADQRDYTTFCFDKLGQELRQELRQEIGGLEGRLRQEMGGLEGRLTRRLDRHELVLGEILTEVKALRG